MLFSVAASTRPCRPTGAKTQWMKEVADFHRFLANEKQATTLGREPLDEPVLKEEGIL